MDNLQSSSAKNTQKIVRSEYRSSYFASSQRRIPSYNSKDLDCAEILPQSLKMFRLPLPKPKKKDDLSQKTDSLRKHRKIYR